MKLLFHSLLLQLQQCLDFGFFLESFLASRSRPSCMLRALGDHFYRTRIEKYFLLPGPSEHISIQRTILPPATVELGKTRLILLPSSYQDVHSKQRTGNTWLPARKVSMRLGTGHLFFKAWHRHVPSEIELLLQTTRGYDASLGIFSDVLSLTLLCHA
jgi:hypothetical protein